MKIFNSEAIQDLIMKSILDLLEFQYLFDCWSMIWIHVNELLQESKSLFVDVVR